MALVDAKGLNYIERSQMFTSNIVLSYKLILYLVLYGCNLQLPTFCSFTYPTILYFTLCLPTDISIIHGLNQLYGFGCVYCLLLKMFHAYRMTQVAHKDR